MALIALASAKGSPGVTTTALAFTLSWGRRIILAECDPAGGSVMAGYLRGQLGAHRGLIPLAVAELRGDPLDDQLWVQLVDLDAPRRDRLLLPGLTDPAQAGSLPPVWARLAAFFTGLEDQPGYDVLADCGRLAVGAAPWPLLQAADAVLLVVRPNLPSVTAAVPAVAAITRQLTAGRDPTVLGLVVAGDGPYSPTEIARQLKTPLVAHLPRDDRTADALSFGGEANLTGPLMRAAAAAESRVHALATGHRRRAPRPAASGEVVRAAH